MTIAETTIEEFNDHPANQFVGEVVSFYDHDEGDYRRVFVVQAREHRREWKGMAMVTHDVLAIPLMDNGQPELSEMCQLGPDELEDATIEAKPEWVKVLKAVL